MSSTQFVRGKKRQMPLQISTVMLKVASVGGSGMLTANPESDINSATRAADTALNLVLIIRRRLSSITNAQLTIQLNSQIV